MNWIIKRLSEPSSAAGIGVVLSGVTQLPQNPEIAITTILGGVMAFLVGEKK